MAPNTRNMVEAAGIEPASKIVQRSSHSQAYLIYSQTRKVTTKNPFPTWY